MVSFNRIYKHDLWHHKMFGSQSCSNVQWMGCGNFKPACIYTENIVYSEEGQISFQLSKVW